MNLATTYMGIPLSSPMIVGSSPLTEDLDLVKQLEDAGASALVLRTEVEAWMIANEWTSLEEMRGNMSFQRIPNPAVYEREAFRRMFQ